MPDENEGWRTKLVLLIPWEKLRRYEIANLTGSGIAFYFTTNYAVSVGDQLNATLLLFFVTTMMFVCILWACEQ